MPYCYVTFIDNTIIDFKYTGPFGVQNSAWFYLKDLKFID